MIAAATRPAFWLVLLFALATHGAAALAGEIAFTARVGDLGLQTGHIARGLTRGDSVTVTLPGERFVPPRRLDIVPRAEADRTTPAGALQSDFSAWKADDTDWIRENFAARERPAITAFLANPEMRAASRAGFARYDAAYLWSVVSYGDYALALFTYGQGEERAYGLTATFVFEDGGWRKSNALSRDETLDIVWTAFRQGEISAAE